MRVKKIIRQRRTAATELASLAGRLEDARRSNAALHGTAAVIMRTAAKSARSHGWRLRFQKTPKIQYLLKVILSALMDPIPLPFWREEVAINGQGLLQIASDASSISWGAVTSTAGDVDRVLGGQFDPATSTRHITYKETLALKLALAEIRDQFPSIRQDGRHNGSPSLEIRIAAASHYVVQA